jgi:hypothetical protein
MVLKKIFKFTAVWPWGGGGFKKKKKKKKHQGEIINVNISIHN